MAENENDTSAENTTPETNGENGAGEAAASGEQQAQPQMSVVGQYIKDLSFENPAGAKVLNPNNEKPNLEVQVNVNAAKGAETVYEVELKVNVNGKYGTDPAFICELSYGGLFNIVNVPDEQLQPLLLVECPRIIFPFARRIIADATRDGGYPPLLLDPIDFLALYRQQMAQQQQQAATQPAEGTA